jgi:guanine deaminase
MAPPPPPVDRSGPHPDDSGWLQRAVELAVENVAAGGGPFAAMVVHDGQLVATGVNQVVATLDPTAHGEVVAIRNACREIGDFTLAGATLYSSCELCPLCLAAALWSRVDRVLYAAPRDAAVSAGFDDGRFADLFAIPPDEWPAPVTRIDVPTAREPFEAWEAKPDKVPY